VAVHARFGKTLALSQRVLYNPAGQGSGSPRLSLPTPLHEPRQTLVRGLQAPASAEATKKMCGMPVGRTYPLVPPRIDMKNRISTYCVSRPSPVCHSLLSAGPSHQSVKRWHGRMGIKTYVAKSLSRETYSRGGEMSGACFLGG
jgi:hypothetical protein